MTFLKDAFLAFREGFLKTQQDMWGDLENWSKTGSGLPSTAGTTASIAFIRRGKIFVGEQINVLLSICRKLKFGLWRY